MPHIYNDVHKLVNQPLVGTGDCVALVQKLTDVGWTGGWRPWVRVLDAGYIRVGTVIATFDKHGRYPNKPTGNHAAFFVAMGPLDSKTGRPQYFVAVDQWKGQPVIKQHKIYPLGQFSHIAGGFSDSQNADTFWVVQ